MGTTTSPDNLWSTTDADPLQLDAITATMQSSVQVALNNRAILSYRWADATARANQSGMSAGDEGYQIDTDTRYYYDGTVWRSLSDNYKIYATEATLLLTTEPAGVLAYAQDTGVTYQSTGTNWVAVVNYVQRMSTGGSQSIPTSTQTRVNLLGTVFAKGDALVPSLSNTAIGVARAGRYKVSGSIYWNTTNSTGVRELNLFRYSASNVLLEEFLSSNAGSSSGLSQYTERIFEANAGDYFTLVVLQASGVALNINTGSDRALAVLRVESV